MRTSLTLMKISTTRYNLEFFDNFDYKKHFLPLLVK